MRVLGIESSSLVASVALVTDDIMTAEYTVDFKKTHSQTLLPMLDEIVKLLVPLPACASAQPLPRDWDWPLKSLWYMFLPWMPWHIICGGRQALCARSWMLREARYIPGFIMWSTALRC